MLINVLLLETDSSVANNLLEFWGSQNCVLASTANQARRFIPEHPSTVLHIGPRMALNPEVQQLIEDFTTDDSTLFVLINNEDSDLKSVSRLPKDSYMIPYIRLTRPSENLDRLRSLLSRRLDFDDLLQLRRSLQALAQSGHS